MTNFPYVQSHNGYHYLRFNGQPLVRLAGEFASAEFVSSYRQALAEAQRMSPVTKPRVFKKYASVVGPVVYVFGFDQYVKIGFSTDFRNRRRQLQDGLPRALDTYLIIPGGSFDAERELHKRFAKYRLRGEWFLFAGELADWIEAQVGILSDRDIRRAEFLPEHRLAIIKSQNKNEWLDERAPPNPWEVMAETEIERTPCITEN
jgi:hypothetical protein